MINYTPEKDSPYCIIFGDLALHLALKSCETFHLAKLRIFGYNKDTERVIPMI